MLYALVAAWGVLQVASRNHAFLYYAFGMLLPAVGTSWAVVDSRIRGRTFPGAIRLIYFLTWPAASFIYLCWSRGIRGAGYWLLHLAGLTAVMLVTFIPTALLFETLGWATLDQM